VAVVIDPQVGGGTEEMWYVLRSQKKHFVLLKVPCQRWLFTAALSYTVKKNSLAGNSFIISSQGEFG
jgi:hypothetical protein